MAKKQMTIEDLAQMIKRGFDQTATKEELSTVRHEVHDFRKDMVEELGRMEADIRDIKISVGPLVRTTTALYGDVEKLHVRVSRLERKAGMTK